MLSYFIYTICCYKECTDIIPDFLVTIPCLIKRFVLIEVNIKMLGFFTCEISSIMKIVKSLSRYISKMLCHFTRLINLVELYKMDRNILNGLLLKKKKNDAICLMSFS